MKAFVTGSTGLLGSNLVELLLGAGHEVKALVRTEKKASLLPVGERLTVVRGDLEDVAGFAGELSGCDVVFHCAAYYREYSERGDHQPALQRLNVLATTQLLEASRAQGVLNVVFVSSNGATGAPAEGAAQDEGCGYDEATENLYFRSKIEAERSVDAFRARYPEMRIVVVRPVMMFGPRDSGPTPAGRVILRLLRGEMPLILPGNLVLVDARDVARALLAAATRGESGERFIVGGRSVSFRELAETLSAASGCPVPSHRPPYPVAMAILAIASLVSRNAPVRPRDLRRMRRLRAPDSTKARDVLGVEYRELAESCRDAAAFFGAQHG